MHREKKHKEETEHKSDINIGNEKKRRCKEGRGESVHEEEHKNK